MHLIIDVGLTREPHPSLEEEADVERETYFSVKRLRRLGRGSEGEVWMARHQQKLVALKILSSRESILHHHHMAQCVMERLRLCPYIVASGRVYREGDLAYVVQELCDGGDLLNRIRDAPLAEPEAAVYARHILMALAFSHGAGVAHCDVKPENMLLQADPGGGGAAAIARLGDWGSCVLVEPSTSGSSSSLGEPTLLANARSAAMVAPPSPSPFAGSDLYMAPEVTAAGGSVARCDARAADVWSLGASLLAVLAGDLPWNCTSLADKSFHEFMHSGGSDTGGICLPRWLSHDLRDLLSRMLSLNPAARPTARDALSHPWLRAAAAAAAAASSASSTASAASDASEPNSGCDGEGAKFTLSAKAPGLACQRVAKCTHWAPVVVTPLADNSAAEAFAVEEETSVPRKRARS